jgi:hypothetical protein
MDSDLDSSFFLLRMLAGPLAVIASIQIVVVLFAPMLLYVIARWRAHREPAHDTQVGIKFALHYFATAGLQLALIGGTILLYTMISPGSSDTKGTPYRVALGLLVPAGIVLGAHLALLKRTNDAIFPTVRRLFLGFNMIVVGIVGMATLVMGFEALFAKGSTGGMGHAAASGVLIYGTAWLLLGWRFAQVVLGDQQPPLDLAPPAAPPAGMPPPSSPATSGSLPSLGGGSYPPLDRR